MAGYPADLIDESWPAYVLNQAAKATPSTAAGFCAAFLHSWLPRAKRWRKTEATLEGDIAAAERKFLAERSRESKRREAIEERARLERAQPDPDTARRMADLRARLEEEAPDAAEAVEAIRDAGVPWTPPSEADRAKIQAELKEEMRKVGGLQ